MSISTRVMNSQSQVSQSLLRDLGYTHQAMQVTGEEIAKCLRDNSQEFSFRPRVTPEVQLLKFRTIMTSREVIVRHSKRMNSVLVFRFIDHSDRFTSDTVTRNKIKELSFDLKQPNILRRIAHIVHDEVLPWLKISAESLRKPSIRMPVKRESSQSSSRFMPGSFRITNFQVREDGITVFSSGRALQTTIPYSEGLLSRLQDTRNTLYVLIFASGNKQVLDEPTFNREFVYIDTINIKESV